jgi:hypothetical protein
MASFEFTSPEGKRYTVNGPEGSTKEQAYSVLKEQINQGIAKPEQPSTSMMDKVLGVAEAPLSMATGILGGVVGSVAGVARGLTGGKLGTQEGVREADKFGGEVASAMTYQPRTETGNKLLQAAGSALQDSGIMGVPIPELNMLGRAVASSAGSVRGLAGTSAAAMGAQDAAQVAGGSNKLMDLIRAPSSTMSGGGAAETANQLVRSQRAESLPVPIKLTQGQQTRGFDQVQFERETAKLPEGNPLRLRYEEQNKKLGQNLSEFADQTGANTDSARAVGKSVVDALEEKQTAKKAEINAAYKEARDAGQMEKMVDVTALTDFVNKNQGKSKLAPIVSVIDGELKKNARITGTGTNALLLPEPKKTMMTVNASEDLRQAINKLSEPGTPNVVYGIEAKKIIDAATEGQGGPLYQRARRMNENYSNEFTNRDSIDSLLRNKPGTKDRAVAFEDVFKKSIMDGSLDDVRHIRRVLQTSGENGQQAYKDLQGATLDNIKEQMMANVNIDSAGNTVGSASKIDKLVRELDKDGKLDFIFGKQGAQSVRDVRDTALDIYTSPKGTINESNNRGAFTAAMDKLTAFGTSLPYAGKVIKYGVDQSKSNALSKKVTNALNYNPEKP